VATKPPKESILDRIEKELTLFWEGVRGESVIILEIWETCG
jgi:hypothetical protein